MRPFGRESHGEACASELAVSDHDGAAVEFGDVAHDREAEAVAAARPVAGIVEAHEPVEDPLASFGRDPGPVVLDDEFGGVRCGADGYPNVGRGMPKRVGQQIAHESREL